MDDPQCGISSQLPPEVDYPAATSAVRAHVILIVIADKIYDPFLTTHLCANVDHSLANLDPREEHWRDAFPGILSHRMC